MTDEADDTTGARIRAARIAKGIEQRALAETAGVMPHTIWRIEAGQIRPRVEQLDRIADALGVTSAWLLHGDEADVGALEPEPGPPSGGNVIH